MESATRHRAGTGRIALVTVGAAGALILLASGILLRGRVPGIDVWALEVLTLDGDVGRALPSTHVTMVTVGLLVAAGVLWRLTGRWHAGATIVVAVAIAATAATRVLLAEHHLTDVGATAAGYAGLALLCVGLLRYAGRPRPGRSAQAPA